MASINTRYGNSQSVADPNDEWITHKLLFITSPILPRISH